MKKGKEEPRFRSKSVALAREQIINRAQEMRRAESGSADTMRAEPVLARQR